MVASGRMSEILVVIMILPEVAGDGTLSKRVQEATLGVAAVGALPLGFQVKLGPGCGEKDLPAGLHAAEASYVSASSLSAFRTAIVRSVWSTKMPLASTPVPGVSACSRAGYGCLGGGGRVW